MRKIALYALCLALFGGACDGSDEPAIGGGPGRTDAGHGSADASGDGRVPSGRDCNTPVNLPPLTSVPVANSGQFTRPVFMTQAPGSDDTLWVVEKRGVIRLVRDGAVLATPFLDIEDKVESGARDERGLLGLAFHPNYESNGKFYVFYTHDRNDNLNFTRIAQYTVSANPDVANTTETILLEFNDNDDSNHVGGMIAFGLDGHLYVGVGDGGGGGDPNDNGLNKNTLLGAILRLDVDDAGANYVPDDNPFVGTEGDDRIWAYGLRNPWRFSVDPYTGDLYIGDVGQNKWEEISIAPAGQGGLNFGWNAFEATHVFDSSPAAQDLAKNHTEPVLEIEQDKPGHPFLRDALSVTGGYVYSGSAIPEMQGLYLFGDYVGDDIASFRLCDGVAKDVARIDSLTDQGGGLASFGTDNAGEMYLVFYGSQDVRKIVRQ